MSEIHELDKTNRILIPSGKDQHSVKLLSTQDVLTFVQVCVHFSEF